VPGDGLAFAIGVSCQDQFISAFDGPDDVGQTLFGSRVDFPTHGEIFIGPHRAILGRQVADVAETGQDFVVLAQIFVDRLGLGRTLDNDHFHAVRTPI
jgi:hypothetical protein